MPPVLAHDPMEITHRGSAICSYSRSTTGATFLNTVPEMIIISACRGDKRKTSAPNRAMSYRGVKAVASSTKQQESPKYIGQRLLARAQLMMGSSSFGNLFKFILMLSECLSNCFSEPQNIKKNIG